MLPSSLHSFGSSYQTQIAWLITTAFGTVTGIALNDAVTTWVKKFHPKEEKYLIIFKFLYVIVLVLTAALIILLLSKTNKSS
jgi:O-antigen/teichoic acid export membrane protein